MRKQLSRLFISAALVLAAASIPANAQSARVLVASIPFNFIVKNRALPAGEYTIEAVQLAASQALKLQSKDGHITVIVPARFAGNLAKRGEPTLIFNRFGDEYFLAQVMGFEERVTHSLVKSRDDDELAKDFGGPKRQIVSVVGRRR